MARDPLYPEDRIWHKWCNFDAPFGGIDDSVCGCIGHGGLTTNDDLVNCPECLKILEDHEVDQGDVVKKAKDADG